MVGLSGEEGEVSAVEERSAMAEAHQPLLRSRSSSLTDVCADDEEREAGKPVYASRKQTFMNVLKGNVGPGCLSLPFAFSQAGSLLGPLGFFVLSSMAVYNMHLLLGCQSLLQRHGIQAQTYGDVAVRSFGRLGRDVVDSVLVFTQLGICSVYFVFFVDSFPRSEGSYHLLHTWQLVLVALPIPLGLAGVGNVKDLAPFSALANCAISVSLAVVLALALARLSSGEGAVSSAEGLSASRPRGLPLFIGNAIFAMEGIGLVLPCANQAVDKAAFPRVLSSAMLTACCFYLLIGLLCFLSYGYIRDASITAEMEHRGHATSTTSINLLLCGAVLLSHPLQLRPAAEVLSQRLLGGPAGEAGDFRFRAALVGFTALVAVALPNLGEVIGLCGSAGAGTLGLVLPPLMSLKLRRTYGPPPSRLQTAGLLGTAAFGASCALWGTAFTLGELVH